MGDRVTKKGLFEIWKGKEPPDGKEENKWKNKKELKEEKEPQKGKKKDKGEQSKGKGRKEDNGASLQGGASSSGQIHDANLEQNNSEASSTRQTDDTSDSGPNSLGASSSRQIQDANLEQNNSEASSTRKTDDTNSGPNNSGASSSRQIQDANLEQNNSAAWLRTSDSAWSTLLKSTLSTFERTKTQSVPLPATETSDNKGGVPIETKGWNSLHTAAESGNEGIIEILLSSGLDIDSRGNDGTTPLMVAAAAGKEETVNLLLEHGADPSLKGKGGWSLLHVAAQSGNVAIIDTMLSKGLNIDSRGETLGLTPLLVSLKNDKLEAAKHLIEKGANVSLKFNAEMNALSIAALTGSVAAIKMLLPHGLYIDSRDADGNTPSLMAARCGNTEALNYLLAKGADPLLQNNKEFGLLHSAALSNDVATIEAVLSKNFDINVRGSCMSLTPLLACLNMGNLEAANYLLQRGADEHIKGKEGLTALSVAARSGNVAAIQMLVSRGHDPNSRDGCYKTPIMWAVESGNQAAVEYLLPLTHEGLLQTTD